MVHVTLKPVVFFANNSVIIAPTAMKFNQNLARLF